MKVIIDGEKVIINRIRYMPYVEIPDDISDYIELKNQLNRANEVNWAAVRELPSIIQDMKDGDCDMNKAIEWLMNVLEYLDPEIYALATQDLQIAIDKLAGY
jgi:hypothetical protein